MPHLWNTMLPTTTHASCTALYVTKLFAKPYLSMENIVRLYYNSFSTLLSFKNIVPYRLGENWCYHHWNGTKFNLQHQHCTTDYVLRMHWLWKFCCSWDCSNCGLKKKVTEFKYRTYYLGGVEENKPIPSVSSISATFYFRNHLKFNFQC